MMNIGKNKIYKTTFECKRDDLVIRGTEYKKRGENLPIAIVSHGFMAFQATVKKYAICLAKMGYAAYTFDFCGGSVVKGKSDGNTTDMSVLTEVRDLEAVLEFTKAKKETNAEHILLMGCSQGGFVSAITAAKHKEEIKELILFYPAFCIPDDARKGKMMFAKFDPENLTEIIPCGPMKLGKCYVEDVKDMDPYERIAGYRNDVLIVHGSKDKIVAPIYSVHAYETYKFTSDPEGIMDNRVALKMIKNGKHGFSKKHDVQAIGEIENFLKKQ